MALLTFKGGVHPNDGKALAKDKAIVEVTAERRSGISDVTAYRCTGQYRSWQLVIMSLRGQMIAEAGGFVSAPIYASVSGTVKAIEPHFNSDWIQSQQHC